jgi:small subunit ribosomal protein S3Ae
LFFFVCSLDPFAKKEWYDVKAPASFPTKQICKTVVTKTQGTRLAADGLRNRVFELNLGDLKPNSEEDAFRKLKFRVEEVQGKACLTNFYGMDMTTDKLRSLVRKWQSLIECHTEVKTSDGFNLRVFAIAFTKRRPNQAKKTAYAQSGQVKNIRKKMVEIIQRECSSSDLMTLCNKFMAETIGKEIEKACAGIYPLQNVFVRKVKSLRAPKLEIGKLLELHGGAAAVAAMGQSVAREEESAPAAEAEEDDE